LCEKMYIGEIERVVNLCIEKHQHQTETHHRVNIIRTRQDIKYYLTKRLLLLHIFQENTEA